MSSPSTDPLVGHDVGEYHVTGVLGRGGMGVVYEAEDTALGITVALKMIDPALARDAAFVRRFRAEARAMARIPSPHIVRVMAMRQTEHGLFLVMECVDGGTLHDRMAGAPIPWGEAWPYVRQMLLALEKAHSVGVIHRDIKPRNVMLTRDGVVKVTDFGLAKDVSGDASATVTQAVSGTLLYMSPEQVKASPTLDARSDLFALALTVYEMLAARLPFDRDAGEFAVMRAIVEAPFPPPTKFNPAIPAPVARALMKALEKDPEKRYASAAAMREAFELLAPAGGEPARARPVRSGGVPRAALWGVAALGLLLAAALLLWAALPGPTPEVGPVSEPPLIGQAEPRPETPPPADPLAPTDAATAEPSPGEVSPREVAGDPRPAPATPAPRERPEPRPAEPAPAARGTLTVESRPGVSYSVGGSRVDGSVALAEGNHTVRCTAGGVSVETRVRIAANARESVACYAEQVVNVSASFEGGPSSWLWAWVNGERVGQTPRQLTLGPGRHTISARRDGYTVLTPEQVVEVRPSFEPLARRLVSFQVRAEGS